MDLSGYSSILKKLCIIPVLVGILLVIEPLLPEVVSTTSVVSKSENYRSKTETITYTIYFDDIDDQFTEEIYNGLSEGDVVTIRSSYINKQISTVTNAAGEEYENSTGEWVFVIIFGIAFLLSGLAWLKNGNLTKGQAKIVALIILFSAISLIRILVIA